MNLQSNRTIIDLNKVQHATLLYQNQYGKLCPVNHKWSVQCIPFDPQELHISRQMTMGEFAIENDLLDQFTPVLKLQLTANHTATYTGDKAISLYKDWCAKIFGKHSK